MVSRIAKTISTGFIIILAITYTQAAYLNSESNGIHTFGQRVNNDRIIYRVENPVGNAGFFNFKFGGPDSAGGPDITRVEIAVSDIFNETHAYISSGGIGEKSIVIVLAVLHKTPFSYKASVYGL